MNIPRSLLPLFRSLLGSISLHDAARREEPFSKAKNIAQYFYYYLAFLAVLFLPWWDGLRARQNFSPLWPIAWAHYVTLPTAITIVQFSFVAGALLGALFHWNRLGRIAALLGIVQYHALESSFGAINHQWYPWLYTALLFLFLPDLWGRNRTSIEERKKFLLVFWAAQALFLLTYSMSGLAKVWGALQQLAAGEPNAFLPGAFALQIADWITQMQARPLLAPFLIAHPLAGWPFYLGMLYLQSMAFLAAFRPRIQKLWAFGLILFHIGTYLTMSIYFLQPVLLLLLFFFDSPFKPSPTNWRRVLADLPIFGCMFKRILRTELLPKAAGRNSAYAAP